MVSDMEVNELTSEQATELIKLIKLLPYNIQWLELKGLNYSTLSDFSGSCLYVNQKEVYSLFDYDRYNFNNSFTYEEIKQMFYNLIEYKKNKDTEEKLKHINEINSIKKTIGIDRNTDIESYIKDKITIQELNKKVSYLEDKTEQLSKSNLECMQKDHKKWYEFWIK